MADASGQKPQQGAVTGGWICLLIGSGLMIWTMFSFFIYLPVFLAAFVLGIVAISQHRIGHGVTILLLSIIWPIMLGFAINDYSKYKRSGEQQTQYNYNKVPDNSERIPVRGTYNQLPPSMEHHEYPTELQQEKKDETPVKVENDFNCYDIEKYCHRLSSSAGGSYMIENSCREQERESRNNLIAMQIPEKTYTYCRRLGNVSGGSYMLMESCCKMEIEARNNRR